MALINHRAREIHFKIVYYGPGLGGKTTNLRVLHAWLPAERRGRMVSIAADNRRTLVFRLLPIERLRSLLNPESAQEFEAVACEGRGVNETLKAICKAVLARLTTEPATESSGPMPVLVMRRPGRAALAAARAEAQAAEAATQV